MQKIKFFLLAVCLIAALPSCATILSGTTQNISVQVVESNTNNPLQGVNCNITDGKGGVYHLGSNPGSVMVTKGNGALNPICKKPGYIQRSFGMGDSFNAVSIVNVLFWPGFIVDAITGSIKNYPSHMVIYMERESPSK